MNLLCLPHYSSHIALQKKENEKTDITEPTIAPYAIPCKFGMFNASKYV